MLWSRFFIPTAKETPADATAASHRLAIRAGLIRQVAAGSYTYLPLGYRVLRKIEAVVREEMGSILRAISLSSPMCRARYTLLIPPSPSFDSTR